MYGPAGISVEQINTSTGTVTYLHHDQAGSTRLLTDSTGTVTGKCTYHGAKHGVEAVLSEVGPEELGEPAEQGAAAERESACGKIPTGSKPPRAAYRDLEGETGLSKGELNDALHSIKDHAGLPATANTRIDSEGNVMTKLGRR